MDNHSGSCSHTVISDFSQRKMTPHAYSFFNLMNYWNSFTAVMNANLFYGYDNTKLGIVQRLKDRTKERQD